MAFDLDVTIGLEEAVDVRRQLFDDAATLTHCDTGTSVSWPLPFAFCPLTSASFS
jgi:hypothetical protein